MHGSSDGSPRARHHTLRHQARKHNADAWGRVKILDFGVAKQLPRSDQSSTVDRSGSTGGTPAYMAPEALLEKLPDERSDIFSLGVVLYEMLTRKHPFLANSFVATSERVLHETPTAIRTFNPHVPATLDAIVMKSMAKAATQRFPNAGELLGELRLAHAGATPNRLTAVVPALKKGRREAAVGGESDRRGGSGGRVFHLPANVARSNSRRTRLGIDIRF